MMSSNAMEMDSMKSLHHLGTLLLNSHSLPPHKLRSLLHELALVLSAVDQSPSEPIKKSLEPSIRALISDELLRHADESVKISVTCCLTEIARITAPEAPYDDEQMKEIFKLIVAAFEKLSHVSGYCYDKAYKIIFNVERVRLCLVMLDLELDDLVIEMFQQFLTNTRSNHPREVVNWMETIMTMVLNESEEISSDLLRPLLDSARKENQVISPMSWTLADNVFTNCAVKLKPYLMNAVESSGRALDEYAQIVTTICQNGSEFPQHAHSNGSKKTKVQVPESELGIPKDADKKPGNVTKITGVRSAKDDENFKKSHLKGKNLADPTKSSNSRNTKANAETAQEPKSETQLNTVTVKRVRKPNSLMNEEEGYGNSRNSKRTKTVKSAISSKAHDNISASPSVIHESRKDELQSKQKTVTKEHEPDITCLTDAQIMDDTKSHMNIKRRKKNSDPTKYSNSRKTIANAETAQDPTKNSNNTETAQEPKSETQLSTVLGKRVRKPNSLMNEEEGYGKSWISNGTKAAKPTLSKKARDCSSAFPTSEIQACRKDKLQSKPKTASEALVSEARNENNEKDSQSIKIHDIDSADENPVYRKNKTLSKPEETSEGHEALVSKPKTDENNHVAYPSICDNIPRLNESCTKSRQPRKRSSTWNDSKFLSKLDDGKVNPLFEETSLESRGVSFEEEPRATKVPEVKPQTPIRRIRFTLKNAEKKKTAMAPEKVGAEKKKTTMAPEKVGAEKKKTAMEAKASSADVEKYKSVIKTEVENGEDSRSSFQTGERKKRMCNATPKRKDLNESSAIKSSETRNIGDSLVGSRIKVWWPMDKMFYEGVVQSYDPGKGKHKILYDDGEVEVLNLKRHRWEQISAETSPDEEPGLALHKLAEASYMDIASTSISKRGSAKSAVKSEDTLALDRSGVVADKAMDSGKSTVKEHKSKRMKASSCIKKDKPKTNGLAKKLRQ